MAGKNTVFEHVEFTLELPKQMSEESAINTTQDIKLDRALNTIPGCWTSK